MKKKLPAVFTILILLLVVVYPASARVASHNYSPEVVAATNTFSPSVLKAVRRNYCPSSSRPWRATERGLQFDCDKNDDSSKVLVDWEGEILLWRFGGFSVGFETLRRGNIESLKINLR